IITTGRYELLLADDPHLFAYMRHGDGEKLLVVNNFYPVETTFTLPEEAGANDYTGELLIANYPDAPADFRRMALRPYESVVYLLRRP
ncbi:alpha-glucosidase C-terminal domain-containing protein, partial [Geobacillus thermodenitrificans]